MLPRSKRFALVIAVWRFRVANRHTHNADDSLPKLWWIACRRIHLTALMLLAGIAPYWFFKRKE